MQEERLEGESSIEKTASKIVRMLEKQYPYAKTALNYTNPLELLVATILSAQCTDSRVNVVTEALFKKYRKAEDYANADIDELEKEIMSTGFYKNKSKNIKRCCAVLTEEFNSQVPNTMKEMLGLPGVARKTANIVLANAYNVTEGIAVDTHVRRLAKRLGLTTNSNPNKIEKDLMRILPRDKWMRISDLLISHGRTICKSRKPKCKICVLAHICPSASKFD